MPNKLKEPITYKLNPSNQLRIDEYREPYRYECYEDGSQLSNEDVASYVKQDMIADHVTAEASPSSKNRWDNLLDNIL